MQIRRGTNSLHYRKGSGKQYWLEVPAVRMIMILMMMTTITTWEIISMPRVMKMSRCDPYGDGCNDGEDW